MTSSTVPVTSKRLGVEGDFYTPLFGDADEEEASHPEMVTHGDALARTNLELPLGRHDLGVDSGNVDTGIKARTVVCFDQITCKDLSGTDTAIIRTLGTGETALGPLEWLVIVIEEGILLFETEPRLVCRGLIHDFLCMMAIVGPVWSSVVVIALCEDEDVGATAEGIAEDGSRTKIDVRVASWGLIGGRTVEIPDTEVTDILYFLCDCSGLAAKSAVTINPDIFSLDLVSLVERKITLEELWLVKIGSHLDGQSLLR
jgi:hypothetical protein